MNYDNNVLKFQMQFKKLFYKNKIVNALLKMVLKRQHHDKNAFKIFFKRWIYIIKQIKLEFIKQFIYPLRNMQLIRFKVLSKFYAFSLEKYKKYLMLNDKKHALGLITKYFAFWKK